jgi:hypothetical protein
MLRRELFKSLIGITIFPSFVNITEDMKKPKYHDIVKWAEENITLPSLAYGKEKLKLRPYQKEILTSWMGTNNDLLVSCRQSGKTTLSAIHAIYKALSKRNEVYMILDIKEDMARHTMKLVAQLLNETPYKDCVVRSTREHIELANGSRIHCRYAEVDSVRGMCVHTLNLQEFDFCKHQDELYRSVIPVINCLKNSKAIIATTLSGKADSRAQYILDQKPDNWNIQKVDYTQAFKHNPRFDKKEWIRNIGKENFDREFRNIV